MGRVMRTDELAQSAHFRVSLLAKTDAIGAKRKDVNVCPCRVLGGHPPDMF